jgi:beta-glucosidase
MDAPAGSFDARKRTHNVTTAASAASARRVAAASTVLLKNSNNLLPLKQGIKLAVVGLASSDAITGGGGSGSVIPSYLLTPLAALQQRVGNHGSVSFADGKNLTVAAATAAAADAVVVFTGTSSSEGGDRSDLSLGTPQLPNQDELIKAVAGAQKNTVVVMSSPGVVTTPWSTHDGVGAILARYAIACTIEIRAHNLVAVM